MRRILTVIAVAAAVAVAGASTSGAAFIPGDLQVDKTVTEAPGTVTVSNVDDEDGRCEDPIRPTGASTAAQNDVEVQLELSDQDGPVQSNTVTPDDNGDWSYTYTDLPVGMYQVNGLCVLLDIAEGAGATPSQSGPFPYNAVDFDVVAPADDPDDPVVDDDDDAQPDLTVVGPVTGSPSFTG